MTGAVAFGPTITQSGITPPPVYTPAITCGVYDRSGTLLKALPNSYNRHWQDQLNVEGTGSAVVQIFDPTTELIVSCDIPWRSILIFSIDTIPRYASIIEHMVEKLVAQGEEVDETLELSGRGTLALFEEAVCYPENGLSRQPFTDTRLFSYASIDFDDSMWASAVQVKLQSDPTSGLPWDGAPQDWPDHNAYWIWDRAVTSATPWPTGNVYFRKQITIPSGGDVVRFFITADDGFELYVDGGLLQSDTEAYLWGVTRQVDLFLDSGTHLVAIKGTNLSRASSSTNYAGIICSMYVANGDGSLGGLIAHTDSSWKMLAYPPNPPGYTVGQILRILTEEAQARGTLSGISLSFNDTNDSNGVPWATLAEVPIQVGDDMLTTIKQLASAYCDVAMGIGTPVLFAYNTRGSSVSTTFSRGVNLGDWTQDGAV